MVFAHLAVQGEVSHPKRALIHLPTHFPPPFSSPCQDQAGSGIQQTLIAEYGGGEGGRGEDGGEIVITYQNSRKWH